MANTSKNKEWGPYDPCANYSFTEFSPGLKTEKSPSIPTDRFVNGVVNPAETKQEQDEDKNDEKTESEQSDLLIEQAYTKGLDQGRSEIMMAFKEKVDQAVFALQTAIEEYSRLREQDLKQMETETVRLSLAIVKKIIGIESTSGEIISHVVKQAMKKVSDPRVLTLRVNPKDMETVKEFNEANPVDSDMPTTFHLEEDETILQGGCIIDTKLGNVDARIDQQIKIIENQLLAHLPESTG